jgi:glycosyltransferase involved in cell wall biosynthesis
MKPGTHILMITPLDCRVFMNNLEHNNVHYLEERGHRVTLIYKKLNRSPGILNMLIDSLTFKVRSWHENSTCYIEIDPPFNYFAGLRNSAETDVTSSAGKISPLKLFIIRLLSPLAVLRDVFFVPAVFLAARRLRKDRPDLCLGWGPWGTFSGWLIRKCWRIRYCLVHEDRDYEPGLLKDPVRRWYTARLDRFCLNKSDLNLCIGSLLRNLRVKHTQQPVHVSPSGVDWDLYEQARTGGKQGETLVYVGQIMDWSGLDCILEALPLIHESCPGVRLMIVGDGPDSCVNSLKSEAARLKLDEHVQFFGPCTPAEIPSLLEKADIGLANSRLVDFRRYACPLKVVEYMAAGLPVLVTEDTEASEMVKACECGLAVPFDPGEVARAIVQIFSDSELYEQYRTRGIEHSRELSWKRLLDRKFGLISSLKKSGAG